MEESSKTTTQDIISTPGEILKEEFLEPLGISQYRLAKAIGKSQSAITDIIHSRRSITPEMAYLIGTALGTGAEFWLQLQVTYQVKTMETAGAPEVEMLVRKKRKN